MRKLILVLMGMALLVGCDTTIPPNTPNTPTTPQKVTPPSAIQINSFETCLRAGNPVMESYPRQCKVEGGRTYVEEIERPIAQPPSDTVYCAQIYQPVCAKIQVLCIKAPCPPIFETISNECMAKARGSLLLSYTKGECNGDEGRRTRIEN